MGQLIQVDNKGNPISGTIPVTYPNDSSDPTKAGEITVPDAPEGWVIVILSDGDQFTPTDPGQDKKIKYEKLNQVVTNTEDLIRTINYIDKTTGQLMSSDLATTITQTVTFTQYEVKDASGTIIGYNTTGTWDGNTYTPSTEANGQIKIDTTEVSDSWLNHSNEKWNAVTNPGLSSSGYSGPFEEDGSTILENIAEASPTITTGNVMIDVYYKGIATANFVGIGEKVYDGHAITNYSTPIAVTITAPNTVNTIPLTAGTDYVWKKAGQTYTAAPIDVGNYTIELTNAGKERIKGVNINNLDWSDNNITGQGDYIIQAASASAILSGENHKIYDGQTVSINEINHEGTIKVTLNVADLSPVIYKLEAGDYSWVDQAGNPITAPMNAGNYLIKLTPVSLTGLQQAVNEQYGVGNVIVDQTLQDSGQAEFIIMKAAQVIVHYQDVNGLIAPDNGWSGNVGIQLDHQQVLTGQPNELLVFNPATGIWNYSADHYVLVGHQGASRYPNSGTVSVDGNYYIGDYYVYLQHGTRVVSANEPEDQVGLRLTDLNHYISRKIIVHDPHTIPTMVTQNVHFTRKAIVDEITGNVTYSSWQADGIPEWPAYITPVVVGYTPSLAQVVQTNVEPTTVDCEINIIYTANNQEGKISYVDEQGQEIAHTPLSGRTDQMIPIRPEIPAGWVEVAGQTIPTNERVLPTGISTIMVKIKHGIIIVDPDDSDSVVVPTGKVPGDPSKTYEKMDNLISTPTRTILLNYPDHYQGRIMQKVKFIRKATFDTVTGKATYSNWSLKESSTGEPLWWAYAPSIFDGYEPTPSIIYLTMVTGDTPDQTVIVNYHKQPVKPAEPEQPRISIGPVVPNIPIIPLVPIESNQPSVSSNTPVESERATTSVISSVPRVEPEQSTTSNEPTQSAVVSETHVLAESDALQKMDNSSTPTKVNKKEQSQMMKSKQNNQVRGTLLAKKNKVSSVVSKGTKKATIDVVNATEVLNTNRTQSKNELPQTGENEKVTASILGLVLTTLAGILGLGVSGMTFI